MRENRIWYCLVRREKWGSFGGSNLSRILEKNTFPPPKWQRSFFWGEGGSSSLFWPFLYLLIGFFFFNPLFCLFSSLVCVFQFFFPSSILFFKHSSYLLGCCNIYEVSIHTQFFNKNIMCYFLLFNKGMKVNLYKLYFPLSYFYFQQNRRAFHPSNFSPL